MIRTNWQRQFSPEDASLPNARSSQRHEPHAPVEGRTPALEALALPTQKEAPSPPRNLPKLTLTHVFNVFITASTRGGVAMGAPCVGAINMRIGAWRRGASGAETWWVEGGEKRKRKTGKSGKQETEKRKRELMPASLMRSRHGRSPYLVSTSSRSIASTSRRRGPLGQRLRVGVGVGGRPAAYFDLVQFRVCFNFHSKLPIN